jgi:ATP-dependent exoDNAse (exonuclease V) beta subunit
VQDAIALLRFLARPTSNLRAVSLLRSRLVRLSDAGVALLAPEYADALGAMSDRTLQLAASQLDAEDREVLETVRAAVPRWLAMVDRVTPSELLDKVLRETAYGDEMRGARFLQARENLKKLRALVRKAENRGYATLARISEFLDDLAVGDESNAVIDALDAVNLDRARGEGPRVPDRVRRQHEPRDRRPARAAPRAGGRLRHPVGLDWRFRVGCRRGRHGPGA